MSGAPALGEIIDEGATIAVECVTYEGNPIPEVTWTKDGKSLDYESESIQNVEIEGEYKVRSILTVQVCIFLYICIACTR